MKVRINFYDELITINIPKDYITFKQEIGTRYSIDSIDVDELIIFFNDSTNQRFNISNADEFKKAMELFQELTKKKAKLPDILLEVSEKSMLFQREIENSKLDLNNFQLENQKQQEEKEKVLKELLEKEKIERELKEAEEEKERQRQIQEEERQRQIQEEERQRQIQEELERQRQIQEEERRRKEDEEIRIRKQRESALREKLNEMKNKLEKEKAKFEEKCLVECDKNVQKAEEKIEINIKENNKIVEEIKDKKSEEIASNKKDKKEHKMNKEGKDKKEKKEKKEKKQKSPKKESIKDQFPSDKEKKKEAKKAKKEKEKEKEEVKFGEEIDPEFSLILSKVINENMESAKDKILKKAIKEASKIFEKAKKSQVSSQNSMFSSTNVIHANLTCDGCKMYPIVGNRYKCTICENFDYCDLCEEKFAEIHNHPFLKIRKPEIAPVKIVCAIKDSLPNFVPPKEEKINFNSEENSIKGSEPEIIKCAIFGEQPNLNESPTFFTKVKNAVKEIPNNIMKIEGIIQQGVNNLIHSESEERRKFRPLIEVARQNYSLDNITDDQLLDALVVSQGNVDDAIGLLFTE